MKKQLLTSIAFKDNIKKILVQKNTSQNLVATGKIIRDIGQECFNCAPTNVWGKVNGLEGKMSLLDDEQINSSEGLLVLGYGDAEKNGWYGAGPTRDMRRAYYTPMLLALQPNINLGREGFFSTKFSEDIIQFAESLDSLNLSKRIDSFYSQNNNSTTLIYGVVDVSNNENAGFSVSAVNIRKSNINCFCDLEILLNLDNLADIIFFHQK